MILCVYTCLADYIYCNFLCFWQGPTLAQHHEITIFTVTHASRIIMLKVNFDLFLLRMVAQHLPKPFFFVLSEAGGPVTNSTQTALNVFILLSP